MDLKKPITQVLREIMDAKHLNQQELAADLNVNKSQVSRWLSGKQVPKFEAQCMIRNKLEMVQNKQN